MAPSLHERRAGRVLVVERCDDLREFLSMVLASAGFDALQAGDARAALALLEGQRPDLLLVEGQEPAREILEQLESLTPPPAVVVMLATPAVLERADSLRRRALTVLDKPFGVRQLLEACGRALESGLPLPERRRATRQALAARVEVHGPKGLPLLGDILDLSVSGARLRLSQPLEAGALHYFALSPARGSAVDRGRSESPREASGGLGLRRETPLARALGAVAWQAWQDDAWTLGIEFALLPGQGGEVERLLAGCWA